MRERKRMHTEVRVDKCDLEVNRLSLARRQGPC
jgi:hypothetical protein